MEHETIIPSWDCLHDKAVAATGISVAGLSSVEAMSSEGPTASFRVVGSQAIAAPGYRPETGFQPVNGLRSLNLPLAPG
ncbi:hypothetical protein AB0M79_35255 [Polymorphospora sp. NPDC051019]|uniref:hypothetical protein n=1 Tax=Polymorphospora sp. NPDC051019 TaxID=3155725 RepID=UPI003422F5B3